MEGKYGTSSINIEVKIWQDYSFFSCRMRYDKSQT